MKINTIGISAMASVVVIVMMSCTGSKKTEVICGESASDTIPWVVFTGYAGIDVYLPGAKEASLTTKEISVALSLLKKTVESHNNSEMVKAVGADHLTFIDIKNYKVQFLPGTINNEKWVYANCFCDSFGSDWKKDLISVDDGGKCYFQVRLNLTKGEYADFMINGIG